MWNLWHYSVCIGFCEQNSFFTPLAISLQFLFRLFSGFSVVEYLSGHKNNIKLDEIGFPDAASPDIVFHMFSRTQDSLSLTTFPRKHIAGASCFRNLCRVLSVKPSSVRFQPPCRRHPLVIQLSREFCDYRLAY